VKTRILAPLSAALATALGCASAPGPEELQVANGRVLAAAEQRVAAGQPIGGGVLSPMPQGGFAAPTPTPPAFPPTYVYDLKLDDGRVVRTESALRFGVGDCVRFSQRGAAATSAGLVRGTLAKSSDCK